jgi:hypothetical protein
MTFRRHQYHAVHEILTIINFNERKKMRCLQNKQNVGWNKNGIKNRNLYLDALVELTPFITPLPWVRAVHPLDHSSGLLEQESSPHN